MGRLLVAAECLGRREEAQVSLSQALKETDPTAVMPFDFLKLIWAASLGFPKARQRPR